jgi:hypothetical protein
LISGINDHWQGSFITGAVYFPSIDKFLEVAFLVDTGATFTCLMPDDLARLEDDFGKVPSRSSDISAQGIGGTVSRWLTDAAIAFTHDSAEESLIELALSFIVDPAATGLPSLLGRDILYTANFAFNPVAQSVTLDLPVGRFRLSEQQPPTLIPVSF